jgi:hypothetical protein
VVTEVIAGRLTLCQAAGLFGELNALVTSDGSEDIGPFRVASGEESLCRNILFWVHVELRDKSERAAFARLTGEYPEQFGHAPEFPPGLLDQGGCCR